MADPQLIVDWLIRNKKTIARYMFLLQLIAALIFLGVGYKIGERPLHLLWSGARAPGRTVSYTQSYSQGSNWSTFLPAVEFRVGDRFFRFTDWKGSNSNGSFRENVTVLYDPADPTVAMIDRDAANWLPWSIPLGIGLFLFLVATAGGFRLLRGQRTNVAAIR